MKKQLVLGLLFCFLLTNIVSFQTFANDAIKPVIGVVAEETIQELKAGEKGVFKIQIKNASNTVAQQVKISIEGDHPFRSDVANLNKSISYLNPNKVQEVAFDVIVSPNADSKIYEFNVAFDYQNYEETPFRSTQKVFLRVVNNKVEPILSISGSRQGDVVINEGDTTSMVVNIGNTGSVVAKDVKVTVSGFSNEGVILNGDASTKVIDSISPKTSDVIYFKIKAGKDMKTGTFPINVVANYKDDYGKSYERTGILYLTLNGKGEKKYDVSMKIENLKFPTKTTTKQDFTVTFDVVNTSKTDSVNAEVDLTYAPEFISKTGSKTYVKELKAGERKTISYKLMPKAGTPTESYHNYINVKYVPSGKVDETPVQLQEYVGVFVNGEDKENTGAKPKLIIDNYNYGGDVVYAGEEFTLDLFIKNTAVSGGTKNIKVSLTSDEGIFTPVASSNSFFIKSIGPGEVYQHSVKMRTKIDAAVKIYTMTVKMEYEDANGKAYDEKNNPYAESETLSVSVSQPIRLETADMNVPMDAMTGNPFYIEQEFYNMSKATMYNMMVKFEGEGLMTSQSNYFVGNFDAGRSEMFSTQVTAMAPGTYEGKLIYTFEDALGTVNTLEKPFTVNVTEMVMPEPGTDEVMPPVDGGEGMEKPLPWKWIIGGSILGAIVLVGVILKIRKKRRIKRELEALDE